VIVTPYSIKIYGFIDEDNFFICKLLFGNNRVLLIKIFCQLRKIATNKHGYGSLPQWVLAVFPGYQDFGGIVTLE